MIGTKGLSQMTMNNNAVIFIGAIVLYFLADYVLKDMFVYLSGGLIGGTIKEAFKGIGIRANQSIIVITWTLLLIGLTFLYFKTQVKGISYFLLVIIAFFLYAVEFLLSVFFDFKIENPATNYFINLGIRIFLKALILSSIIIVKKSNFLASNSG